MKLSDIKEPSTHFSNLDSPTLNRDGRDRTHTTLETIRKIAGAASDFIFSKKVNSVVLSQATKIQGDKT